MAVAIQRGEPEKRILAHDVRSVSVGWSPTTGRIAILAIKQEVAFAFDVDVAEAVAEALAREVKRAKALQKKPAGSA